MIDPTPGPWKRVGNVIRKPGGGTVAICPNVHKGGVMEFSANARLIAAAPTMKDHLQRIMVECESDAMACDCGPEKGSVCPRCEIAYLARTALEEADLR